MIDNQNGSIKFHSKFKPLVKEDHRFKIYHGGRYGLKTWSFARALLLKGAERTIRALCAREIQRSISESVHATLEEQIELLGKEYPVIADNYIVKKNEIEGRNKTKINFIGLYSNHEQIKSYAGIDYFWVEEAEKVSQKSWDVSIPTFRKVVSKCCWVLVDILPDSEDSEYKMQCTKCGKLLRDNKNDIWRSEIWVTFNPGRDDDPTYEMFIKQKQSDSIVVKTSWRDNKWFPYSPDYNAMQALKKANYSKYLHIWEGEPICNYESLVYRFKRDINLVDYELKYNEGFETWCSWDFGVGDDTAILFYQIIPMPQSDEFPKGYQINIFDEYMNNNQKAEHYRDIVDSKGYLIDRHACDPAGAARGNDLKSWLDKLHTDCNGRNAWHFEYDTYYHGKIDSMIDNANDWLHAVRVNRYQCPNVVKMFERWSYRTDKDDKIVLPVKPNHDEYSHPGTSFYFFCINRFKPGGQQKVRVIK